MANKSKDTDVDIIVRPALPVGNWPTYADVPLRYGCPGNGGDANPDWEARHLVAMQLPYPMLTAWNEPDPHTKVMQPRGVTTTRVNRECAQSLGRVLNAIFGRVYGGNLDKLKADGMHLFGGLYNYRPIRGGSTLSMHAYGAAIDINPDANPMGNPWKDGNGMMPVAVIEAFLAEGWTWGGDFKSRPDPMHFEATQGR